MDNTDNKRGLRTGRVAGVGNFSGLNLAYPVVEAGTYRVMQLSYCTRCGRQFAHEQFSGRTDCGRCGHVTFIPGSRRVQ